MKTIIIAHQNHGKLANLAHRTTLNLKPKKYEVWRLAKSLTKFVRHQLKMICTLKKFKSWGKELMHSHAPNRTTGPHIPLSLL